MKLIMLMCLIFFASILIVGITFNNKPMIATGVLTIFIWMYVMDILSEYVEKLESIE